LPDAKVFEEFASGSGKQSVSTTMVFARLLRNLVRDPTVGRWWHPSSRTRPAPSGSSRSSPRRRSTRPKGSTTCRSTPTCRSTTPRAPRGSSPGGITEAGALATFTALATAYATWGQPMLPVFLFYSMFGFQRVGDLTWALGDMRGRGILAGCTAGRTTLQGEGLQHDDGQSPCWPRSTRRPWSTTPPSPTRWR
jgi:pyruvate dehydrogenase E1 component